MNRMKFTVTLFDYDDKATSEHRYADERTARRKFRSCVTSAQCANVGRVKLFEAVPHKAYFGGGRPWDFKTLDEWYDNDRPQPEPTVQVEGYIVHSVRSLNGTSISCNRGNNKKFHVTEDDAVEHAKSLAEKWSDGHPGLLVLKAVKHVYKCSVRKTHAVVKDL